MIDHPKKHHYAGLKTLWQQAFGDEAAVADSFFNTVFSPQRCLCVLRGDVPVACAYWISCTLDGRQTAYVYAVATDTAFRGQGLCHRLMEQLRSVLARQGYAAAVLRPGTEALFSLYAGMGYRPCCTAAEFTCKAGAVPIELQPVSDETYARLRAPLLPPGSVDPDMGAFRFLDSYCNFYTGEELLLCGWVDGDSLLVQEYLGDPAKAPGITAALGAAEGTFRTYGPGKAFAMYLPLADDCPTPKYLGLPMD